MSDHLDAYLITRAHVEGRAQRTALLRHRHLARAPLALVLWQLGAEPFSAAAVGYGLRPDGLGFSVAGDPRNRDLALCLLAAGWRVGSTGSSSARRVRARRCTAEHLSTNGRHRRRRSSCRTRRPSR